MHAEREHVTLDAHSTTSATVVAAVRGSGFEAEYELSEDSDLDSFKVLCERISNLVLSWDVLQTDIATLDVLLDKVVTHVDMLGSHRRLKIERHANGALIVLQ
jgi:hypothetical protein